MQKNALVLIGIAWNLEIALDSLDIQIVLSLLVSEHGMSFHLFVLSIIFFQQRFVVFDVYKPSSPWLLYLFLGILFLCYYKSNLHF